MKGKRKNKENYLLKPFSESTKMEKFKRLSHYPLRKGRFYLEVDEETFENVVESGNIFGGVTKDKPKGTVDIAIELLVSDKRILEVENTLFLKERIPHSCIKRIFYWIPELEIREDELAKSLCGLSKESIMDFILENNL